MSNKKLAFVHDRIVTLGGAEQVFFDLIKESFDRHGITSPSKVFVLFSDKQSIEVEGVALPVICALPKRLNNIFIRGNKNRKYIFDYRNLIVFHPILCRMLSTKIRNRCPQQTSISSFSSVKNIIPQTSGGSISSGDQNLISPFGETILYLHSPNQYIRENYDEYKEKITGWKGRLFSFIVPILRRRDKHSRFYNTTYTNSVYTATLAQKHYFPDKEILQVQSPQSRNNQEKDKKKGKIIVKYPKLHPAFTNLRPASKRKNYFIFVGRLTTFVREVDKIIELFNETGENLMIVGSGPDEDILKGMAKENITFVGYIADPYLKCTLIKQSRGYINLALESCGIGTMEAIACGVPVFGYNRGGTKELVGKDNGILVENKDNTTLLKAFTTFAKIS